MLHYLQSDELFDKPVLIPKDAVPVEVFKDVYSDYSLLEHRVMLWKLVNVAVTTENEDYREANERDGLLCQCSSLEKILEAAWLLAHENKEPPK